MGIKGDKLTDTAGIKVNQITDLLQSIGNISSKKMFGGYGIFHDGKMFGMIDSKAVVYFKIGESDIAAFEKKGATKHSKMPYHAVPDSIFKKSGELTIWAKKSIAAL